MTWHSPWSLHVFPLLRLHAWTWIALSQSSLLLVLTLLPLCLRSKKRGPWQCVCSKNFSDGEWGEVLFNYSRKLFRNIGHLPFSRFHSMFTWCCSLLTVISRFLEWPLAVWSCIFKSFLPAWKPWQSSFPQIRICLKSYCGWLLEFCPHLKGALDLQNGF